MTPTAAGAVAAQALGGGADHENREEDRVVLVPPHTSRGRPGQGGGDPGRPVSAADLAGALARDLDGAFEQLVVRFQDELFRFAVGMTGDAGAAQDVVQEAFLNAHRAIRGYTPERTRALALRPWLHRIVLNRCRNRWRSRHVELVFPERMPEPADGAAGPEELALREAERVRLLALLAQLPVRLRAACVLKYGRELSYTEIAELLGEPVGTVKANVHRGITQLRTLLNPGPLEASS